MKREIERYWRYGERKNARLEIWREREKESDTEDMEREREID